VNALRAVGVQAGRADGLGAKCRARKAAGIEPTAPAFALAHVVAPPWSAPARCSARPGADPASAAAKLRPSLRLGPQRRVGVAARCARPAARLPPPPLRSPRPGRMARCVAWPACSPRRCGAAGARGPQGCGPRPGPSRRGQVLKFRVDPGLGFRRVERWPASSGSNSPGRFTT
jgi:hypothetical protein